MASEKKPDLGKVLVTGGCGFLGHHLIRLLLRDWTASIAVVDLRCSRNRRPDSDGVKYYEADITNTDRLLSIFEEVRPDVVIHTASPVPQADDKFGNALYKKVNVDGTQALVDVSKKLGVKVFVYTSSASVVSNNVDDLINADERWPVLRGKDQTEYYSETKAAAEEIVLKANRADGSKFLTAALRPAGIVGEGDIQAQHHIINIYRSGKSGWQIGQNDNLFDFTYVENIAHAHLLAARALLLTYTSNTIPLDYERVDGEAFFITNGTPVYFWDFCRLIWNAAGSPLGKEHVWVIPRDLGLVIGFMAEVTCGLIGKKPTFTRQRCLFSSMTRYYSIEKAKARLGYKPIVSLEDGIRKSVKWTLEQGAVEKK